MMKFSILKKSGPAILVIGLLIGVSSAFVIDEREMAVVLQFGHPVRTVKEPGLYFRIPLIQEVRRVPATNQFWANGPEEELEDLPTRDGKKIEVSVWAIWKITDPEKFVRVLRTVDNAELQVVQRIRAGVRDVVTAYDLSEVVRSTDRELTYSFGLDDLAEDAVPGAEEAGVAPDGVNLLSMGDQSPVLKGRPAIVEEIRDRIRQELLTGSDGQESFDRGIELVDVGISNIGFAESVRYEAFERLKAFMDSIAARYQNEGVQRKQEILNQTNAEVQKLIGEGEEQSSRIRGEVEAEIIRQYAEAIRETGDFYEFTRTLEVYEAALKGRTRLILTTDTDIFRMLKQLEPGKAADRAIDE